MAMRILSSSRRQYCVYWHPTGTDDYGNPTYAAPKELRVRWDDRQEVFINNKGEEQISKSKVAFDWREDVKVDGVMWKGHLMDVPTDNLTKPLLMGFGANRISAVQRSPTIRADEEYAVAIL